ncbi:unnamed protein product [Brassica oleracea var. botrytis]|uniref:uncharacterized protein DDB_G0290685-like isoform X1 n=2 Tax=Brassica napus TaxID=3708 RepID=UPI00207A4379|nr:uncharacterized protein DDB_G0290685-like isoform X1 [Brassica napus]
MMLCYLLLCVVILIIFRIDLMADSQPKTNPGAHQAPASFQNFPISSLQLSDDELISGRNGKEMDESQSPERIEEPPSAVFPQKVAPQRDGKDGPKKVLRSKLWEILGKASPENNEDVNSETPEVVKTNSKSCQGIKSSLIKHITSEISTRTTSLSQRMVGAKGIRNRSILTGAILGGKSTEEFTSQGTKGQALDKRFHDLGYYSFGRESSPEPNEVSYGAIEDSPALAHYKGLQARETSSEISKRGFDDERFPSWYLSVIIPPRLVVYVYIQILNGQPAILNNPNDDDVLPANQADPDQQDPQVANVDYHHIHHNHDNHQDQQPDIPGEPQLPPQDGYDNQADPDQSEESEDEVSDHDNHQDHGEPVVIHGRGGRGRGGRGRGGRRGGGEIGGRRGGGPGRGGRGRGVVEGQEHEYGVYELDDDDLLANQDDPDQQDPQVAADIPHNHDNHQDQQPDIPGEPQLPPQDGYDNQADPDQSEESEDEVSDHDNHQDHGEPVVIHGRGGRGRGGRGRGGRRGGGEIGGRRGGGPGRGGRGRGVVEGQEHEYGVYELDDDDLLANQDDPDQQDPQVAADIPHNHDNHQDQQPYIPGEPQLPPQDGYDHQSEESEDEVSDHGDENQAYDNANAAAQPLPPQLIVNNQANGNANAAAPPLPPQLIVNSDQSEDEVSDDDDENQANGNANAAAPPLPPRGDPGCPLRPLLPRNYHEPRHIPVFRGGRRGRGGGRRGGRGGRGVPGNVHQGEHVPLVDDANVANQQEQQVGGNVNNDNHDQQEDGGNDYNDANGAHANANPAIPPLPVPAPVPQVDDANVANQQEQQVGGNVNNDNHDQQEDGGNDYNDANEAHANANPAIPPLPVPAPVPQVDDVPPPPPLLNFSCYNTTRRLEQDHCQNPEME